MSRFKQYVPGLNVLEAAKRRIQEILDTYDRVAVQFSGGKDSQVVLWLTMQCLRERGSKQRVEAIFLDEEIIPFSVIQHVEWVRTLPWVNLHWFAVPMHNTKVVLGRSDGIVTFDPSRPPLRDPPAHAIRLEPGDTRVFRQQEMDGFTLERLGYPGKVAYLLGIRADESMTRFRSIVNKLHGAHIAPSQTAKRVSVCKPIYDWRLLDVLKYLHENCPRVCEHYEAERIKGIPLRISTVLHGEIARRLGDLPSMSPEFYAKLRAIYPDIDMQARYGDQMDLSEMEAPYRDGFQGCARYIQEKIDPDKQPMAWRTYETYRGCAAKQPEAYPADKLLRNLVKGVFHRMIIPTIRRGDV